MANVKRRAAPRSEAKPKKGCLGRSIALIVLLILVGGLYTAYWLFVQGKMATGFETQIADLESKGFDIQHAGIEIDGYPVHFTGTLREGVITAPEELGGWTVQSEALQLQALSPWPLTWTADLAGETQIDAVLPTGERLMMTGNAKKAQAKAGVTPGGDPRLASIYLEEFRGDTLFGGPPPVSAIENLFAKAEITGDVLNLSLDTREIRLGPSVAPTAQFILGNRITSAKLNCDVDNPRMLEKEQFEKWVADESKIVCDLGELDWGQLSVLSFGLDLAATSEGFDGSMAIKFRFSLEIKRKLIQLVETQRRQGAINNETAGAILGIIEIWPVGDAIGVRVNIRKGQACYPIPFGCRDIPGAYIPLPGE